MCLLWSLMIKFSSVEVSISSNMHASKNIDHRNCRSSGMVTATINYFHENFPSCFQPTVGWKISNPRWVNLEKKFERTDFACSGFLVGLCTHILPLRTFHARQTFNANAQIAHIRKDDRFIFKRFHFICSCCL